MAYKQEPCPLCGRDMTAIETHPGRGELYCGRCDLTIGGNEAKTPDELMALLEQRTCEVEGYDDGIDEGMDGDWYSYAPPTWYLSCGHRCESSERPRYCPVCGRRIVELTEDDE